MDSCQRIFLDCSARQLRKHASRIADCLGRLTEQQIWARGSEAENAVGNLVLHLGGNVRQWIVAGIGGQPDLRHRDAEFDAHGGPASALAAQLLATADEAAALIETLAPDRLTEPLAVQGYHLTVLEAIYHVVEHFSGHTGQIIYATKFLTGEDLGYYKHLKSAAPHGRQTP